MESSFGAAGIVYIALGSTRFGDEALASLRSFRRQMPGLPAALFTDVSSSLLVEAFDHVVVVDCDLGEQPVGAASWDTPGWRTRIDIFASFPFERSLFIDSDTEIVGDISGLFSILDRFDIAAAQAAYRYQGDIPGIPATFPEFNCGVVAMRNSTATAAFLAAWRDTYLDEPAFWHHDQHAFRKAAWNSDARIATLPPEFNLRPARHSGRNVPKILHGFHRPNHQQSTDAARKIRLLSNDHGMKHHRSGWEYALTALRPLTHPNGVILDSMVENTYAWHAARYHDYLPMREPWIGIAHNPPGVPQGYFDHVHPQALLQSPKFKESIASCLGFFALSEYHARWLRERLDRPVDVLFHPVEFGMPQFSFTTFCASASRPLVHIGWWLRRFESFNQLEADGYIKCVLKLEDKNAQAALEQVVWKNDVRFIDHLSNEEFDALLTRSVVFVDLIDCSANNVVVDCIARATPLLVNRHPAVIEYLGADYPLFYDDLNHAAALLQNDDLILAASLHMESELVRSKLSAESFRHTLIQSKLYQALPQC